MFVLEQGSIEEVSIIKNNLKESYSSRIEYILKQRGATKSWLAGKLGISRQGLNHILKHNKKPKYASEIADILQVNLSWLIHGFKKEEIKISKNTLSLVEVYDLSSFLDNSIKNLSIKNSIAVKKEEEEEIISFQLTDKLHINNYFKEGEILVFSDNGKIKEDDFFIGKIKNENILGIIIKENDKLFAKDIIKNSILHSSFDIKYILKEKRLVF